MPNSKPVYIISDSPEKKSDLFGFDSYGKTLADLIAYKENKTPLVIGIYGPWGSGKTTLMETVRSALEKNDYKDKNLYRDCKTVWFQAWKYSKEEEILAALIEEIFKAMKNSGFLEGCKAEIDALIQKLKVSKTFGKLTELITGVDVSEFFMELEYKKELGFYDTFQKFFDRLLKMYLKWSPKESNSRPLPEHVFAKLKKYLKWSLKKSKSEQSDPGNIEESKNVLVIFIDDLDRCPKNKIVQVLETIKLFMDKEGCIFVIGAANEIIEKALEETYGKDAGKFMDKIVQVTFNLPRIPARDFESFVEKNIPQRLEHILPHLPLIIPAMQNNPRQLKRFLNNLSLQESLLKNRAFDIDFKHVLFWNIIDYTYPLLAKDIKDNPMNLSTLRDNIKVIDTEEFDKERWEMPTEVLSKVPQSFQAYVKVKELVNVVRGFECPLDQLQQLITLSEMVESTEEAKEKEQKQEKQEFDKMVEIHDGKFLYGEDKHIENIDEAFWIDVYPVTNSQYDKFIQQGGYQNNDYWGEEGKKWKADDGVKQPKYWEDGNWIAPDHPVVGVSYYEAEAYAKWAGKRLPTEKEWERAARGTDGNEYPWGNEFDKERCNTSESHIEKTTRVNRYPNGISLSGCYDMAGNVWEWASSWYDENKESKWLRGGSWENNEDDARCSNRLRGGPEFRLNDIGFRCVRNKK